MIYRITLILIVLALFTFERDAIGIEKENLVNDQKLIPSLDEKELLINELIEITNTKEILKKENSGIRRWVKRIFQSLEIPVKARKEAKELKIKIDDLIKREFNLDKIIDLHKNSSFFFLMLCISIKNLIIRGSHNQFLFNE